VSDFFKKNLSKRFRGFYPVVIDVETGGFNPSQDALLDIGVVFLTIDSHGLLVKDRVLSLPVIPEPGLLLHPASLSVNKINPHDPNRICFKESQVIETLFNEVRLAMKDHDCSRAVLVGHNAFFDHQFIFAAAARQNAKRNPLHSFSCLDTVTLGALGCGHTVLVKACEIAGISFNNELAHNALYDAQKTAELFCYIVNRWQNLGGWPIDGI